MTKKLQKLRLPFPFTTFTGKRAKSIQDQAGESHWQAFYDRAEKIYHSKDPARRKTYKVFEVNILKALSLAQEENHLKRIADTYALLSKFHFEVQHPERIKTLRASVVAAQNAYGVESKKAAIQMSGLALLLEEAGFEDEASATTLRALEIMEKCTTSDEKLQLNDNVLCIAMESLNHGATVEAALKGIKLTQALIDKQSAEFLLRIEFYAKVLACYADDSDSLLETKPENCCVCGQAESSRPNNGEESCAAVV